MCFFVSLDLLHVIQESYITSFCLGKNQLYIKKTRLTKFESHFNIT
uniref:Uncharacterized protein n=1 Tax=Arundo donax TaxID=35708 RepID=A0A0A9E9F8_ARUDO